MKKIVAGSFQLTEVTKSTLLERRIHEKWEGHEWGENIAKMLQGNGHPTESLEEAFRSNHFLPKKHPAPIPSHPESTHTESTLPKQPLPIPTLPRPWLYNQTFQQLPQPWLVYQGPITQPYYNMVHNIYTHQSFMATLSTTFTHPSIQLISLIDPLTNRPYWAFFDYQQFQILHHY
jgi:hypothetical protein